MKYILSNQCNVSVKRPDDTFFHLSTEIIKETINSFDDVIKTLQKVEVDIFGILGMRNLSAFIGELFAASLIKQTCGQFIKNPHQDGYPDLLLMDSFGNSLWKLLALQLRDKKPFSPFLTGGIEIKATVGNVPTPKQLLKRKMEKPDIGVQRIHLIKDYNWKAHHRETNNLIGILWDFVNSAPTIVAVFYSNQLDSGSWGSIVTPKEGGGRTTSVSIMTRAAVEVMYQGWLAVLDDDRYSEFLNRYNKGTMISSGRGTKFNTTNSEYS